MMPGHYHFAKQIPGFRERGALLAFTSGSGKASVDLPFRIYPKRECHLSLGLLQGLHKKEDAD